MKRKFKLFATVASLCLSVALMAFGVYAASTVTYKVSGTVSYTMTDVLAKVSTKLYKIADYHKGNTDTTATTLAGLGEFTGVTIDDTDKEYQSYDETTNLPKDGTDAGADVTGIAISFNDSTVWKIEIVISTVDPKGLTVELAADNNSFGVAKDANYVVTDENTYTGNITTSSPKTLTYYIVLESVLNPVAQTNFNINLDIKQVQA